MTAGPPTFLSRLSPSVATSPIAVRAALPARYAPDGAAHRLEEQAELEAESGMATRSANTALNERPAGAVTPPVDGPTLRPGAAVAAKPASFAAERLENAPTAIPLIQPRETEAQSTLDPARGAIGQPTIWEAIEGAVLPSHSGSTETQRPSPIHHFDAATEPSTLLKPGTVMERALAAHRAEPDVVQVTIDRIDVRLPPDARQESSPAGPRRRAGPARSLSDYLHGANSTVRR